MFSLGSRRNLVSRIFRAAVAALPSGNGVIAATVMCVAMPVRKSRLHHTSIKRYINHLITFKQFE